MLALTHEMGFGARSRAALYSSPGGNRGGRAAERVVGRAAAERFRQFVAG